mmetsp:Transcript_27564/g.26606  ORF Transcript_27564/g.26606 Transcript_27564/m.26606 type:complete len:93 (+) Transcript_27564:674-952(+)
MVKSSDGFKNKEFKELLHKKVYPGVLANYRDVRHLDFELEILLKQNTILRKYLEKKKIKEEDRFMYLQKAPTLFSEIVECSYYLVFKTKMTN